jgi:hypothetical protein
LRIFWKKKDFYRINENKADNRRINSIINIKILTKHWFYQYSLIQWSVFVLFQISPVVQIQIEQSSYSVWLTIYKDKIPIKSNKIKNCFIFQISIVYIYSFCTAFDDASFKKKNQDCIIFSRWDICYLVRVWGWGWGWKSPFCFQTLSIKCRCHRGQTLEKIKRELTNRIDGEVKKKLLFLK